MKSLTLGLFLVTVVLFYLSFRIFEGGRPVRGLIPFVLGIVTVFGGFGIAWSAYDSILGGVGYMFGLFLILVAVIWRRYCRPHVLPRPSP